MLFDGAPLGRTRAQLEAELRTGGCVFAEQEADVLLGAATDADELAAMTRRRLAGYPLEHIVGWAEFCGMRISVTPGVFVPRRRTELLARQAAARALPGAVVVELCCGAAAVSAAVLAAADEVELHAADIDAAAVRCAHQNIGSAGQVWQGDLYAPLPPRLRGRVDVLVVNTPYVPTDEITFMPAEARLHEPHTALDGGTHGTDIQRRVAEAAPSWLAPGGHLLIETSDRLAPATRALLDNAGLATHLEINHELDAPGAVVGTNTASEQHRR